VLSFVLYDIYTPGSGDEFRFLYSWGLTGLDNVRYTISGLPGSFHYQVYEDDSDLIVRFYADGTQPGYAHNVLYDGRQAPAPSTLALGVLGFALLGWRLRRRRK
jgi:hypothetical protein